MSEFSVEVLTRSERLSISVDLKSDHTLEINIATDKFPNRGHIYVTYENDTQIYENLFAHWAFPIETTTQKFLAGYETEALVEDLLQDCDMPYEEKRFVAHTILWACEKFVEEDWKRGCW